MYVALFFITFFVIEHNQVFVEDMSASEAAKVGAILPAGLSNLQNTCYLNSTLQCLKVIPEFREGLSQPRAGFGGGRIDGAFADTLKELFNSMDSSSSQVAPWKFVNVRL